MERVIEFGDTAEARALFGSADRNLKALKKGCEVTLVARDGRLLIRGGDEAVEKAANVVERLRERIRLGKEVLPETVEEIVGQQDDPTGELRITQVETISTRTAGQRRYVDAILKHDLVICSGPAGTGKTFLAVAKAVEAFQAGRVRRIVLVRPAVEAGERLGFLPGDIQAKVNPYLRPIYDSLNTFLEFGQLKRLIDTDVVEICPLAYMRGRTLDEAFIILDEAQNTTGDQMKMFLTRMGAQSKIVVTGDITQVDLSPGKVSGLVEARDRLRGIAGISIVLLTQADIDRHPLVQKIVDAYEHPRRR
ncbi:MAG: PhoH family protein [Planctomycetota bacterium]|nr:PhoH family protein [Planctomycetota bacterium]